MAVLHLFWGVVAICCYRALAEASRPPYYVIKPILEGKNPETGAYPFRKSISDLSGRHLDLFVQAYQNLQARDQHDKFSWFQLAGELC